MAIEQSHQHKQGFWWLHLGPFITTERIVAAPRQQLHGIFLGEVKLAADTLHFFRHNPFGIFYQFVASLGI